MRKSTYLPVMACFVLGATASVPANAESLTKANHKDIPKLLDAATGTNSAYLALLIGETNDRVYIEYVTRVHASSSLSNHPKRIVYWLPRSEITDEQMTAFEAYKERLAQAR